MTTVKPETLQILVNSPGDSKMESLIGLSARQQVLIKVTLAPLSHYNFGSQIAQKGESCYW